MRGQDDVSAELLEHKWAEAARGARAALAAVGYPELPECMPGEAHPCGGTAQHHALAYFATLAVVCEHQLEHVGGHPSTVADIQLTARAELESGCQGVHS